MKENKIGLVTIHDTQNYGSLLQTFGLYKAIESLGYNIELIDYRNKIITEREKPITEKKVHSPKDILKRMLWGKAQKEKYNNIWKFINKNMKVTESFTDETSYKRNKEFDTFITGSDIVWGTNITGRDLTYFLNFTNNDKKRIAISSSVGTKWEGDIVEEIGNLLARYSNIAVREQMAADWIKELYNMNVKVTCDPTLLWDSKFWSKFINPNFKKKEKYILIYAVNPDKKNISDGIRYAKEHGYKAYFVNFYTPVKETVTVRPTTVYDWITLIANAEVIFSASYHGLLFSLYFNRPVFYYNRGEKSRMISLAKELQIEHREGTNENIQNDKKIDFKEINNSLEKIRKNSWDIIKEFLDN